MSKFHDRMSENCLQCPLKSSCRPVLFNQSSDVKWRCVGSWKSWKPLLIPLLSSLRWTFHLVLGVFDTWTCSLCLLFRSQDESAVDGGGHLPVRWGLLCSSALHPLHLTQEVSACLSCAHLSCFSLITSRWRWGRERKTFIRITENVI